MKRFAQGEGYLQVHDNHALVLVEECIEPEQIDRAEQEERLEQGQSVIDRGQDAGRPRRASAALEQALRDKRRAETFLRIAGAGGD